MINNDLASIDILRIMTRVARRIALDHVSHNSEIPEPYKQKQMPSIQSTLIRDVYFKPKMIPPPNPVVVEVCFILILIFYIKIKYKNLKTKTIYVLKQYVLSAINHYYRRFIFKIIYYYELNIFHLRKVIIEKMKIFKLY